MMTQPALLEITNLKTFFYTDRGVIKAVDDISFSVMPGEVLGVIGESGSGKTVTALSVLGLVPDPPGRIVEGEIKLQGENLLTKSPEEMIEVRGNRIGMIFQDPMTSLDPVFTVEDQLTETIKVHQQVGKKEAIEIATEMLSRVRIPDPGDRLANYPFQLSGGLRQRVMIAMALSCRPELLIADEPTTALDVTIQAQILSLLANLQRDFQMAIMFISHDFGVVSKFADRVAVMYGGKIVEIAQNEILFGNPGHPYTKNLMMSRPVLGRRTQLVPIEGSPPDLLNPPPGCPFAPRCKEANDVCWVKLPAIKEIDQGHFVRCVMRGS
jgi:oligopeptide transport system ATP-binding protein